jgi:integrase
LASGSFKRRGIDDSKFFEPPRLAQGLSQWDLLIIARSMVIIVSTVTIVHGLDPVFAQLLLAWRGDRVSGLVFPSHVTGRSYNAGILQQKIRRPKGVEIGIPKLGWRTFRHTYGSLLDEAGAPVGVQQELMRHSNVATTMNVYGNSTLRAKQDANSKVVKILINPESDKDVA